MSTKAGPYFPQSGRRDCSPADLAHLRAWWRADDVLLTPVGTVQRVNDKSGNGFYLTQSLSGACPTITSSFVNGQPVLNFNGTSQFLATIVSMSRTDGGSPYILSQTYQASLGVSNRHPSTFICVMNPGSNPVGVGNPFGFPNRQVYSLYLNTSFGLAVVNAGSAAFLAPRSNASFEDSIQIIITVARDAWYVDTFIVIPTSSSTDRHEHMIDGGNFPNTGPSQVYNPVNGAGQELNQESTTRWSGAFYQGGWDSNDQIFQMGVNYRGAFPNYYNGYVAEMLIYDDHLDRNQVQYVMTYLQRRYNFPFITGSF